MLADELWAGNSVPSFLILVAGLVLASTARAPLQKWPVRPRFTG